MHSMTGFASRDGGDAQAKWRWDARSVNSKSLDLRLRLPPGYESLEQKIRQLAADRMKRGAVTLALSVAATPAAQEIKVDYSRLAALARAASTLRKTLSDEGFDVSPVSPESLLSLRGVIDAGETETAPPSTRLAAILADAEATLDALCDSRADEGARLRIVLMDQIDTITTLTEAAESAAADALRARGAAIKQQVSALLEAGAPLEQDRIAQELAMIAVRSDIREELDRLVSHGVAARELMNADGPIGRRFEFLTQELQREANTLCSKSTSAALSRIGLDLKVVIDQLREQAQNVE